MSSRTYEDSALKALGERLLMFGDIHRYEHSRYHSTENSWTELDVPDSRVISYGDLNRLSSEEVVKWSFLFAPNYMTYSDYSGSSLDRANCDVFLEKHEDTEGVHETCGDFGTRGVAVMLSAITDEMIEEDRRSGMPEYLIQQEYYGVVQINQETKYFAHPIKVILENKRLIPELMLPGANVYSAFDIGINDCTAITLFQLRRVENYWKPIIIGYMENNNRDLRFYVDEIRRFCARYNLPFKNHFIPHDGQKRDFNTGKNTIDFMQEMGETAYIVPRPTSKTNAIEAMRRKLYVCDFNKENTQRLIDCLSNYSKEFDDKMGTYKNRPLHNWASHGVDAFQTMTLALDADMISDRVYETIYYNQ